MPTPLNLESSIPPFLFPSCPFHTTTSFTLLLNPELSTPTKALVRTWSMSPSNLLIRKMTESALLKPALSFGSKPDSHCLVYVLANPCYHLASTACFLPQRMCVIITSRHLPGIRVKFFTFQISILYSPHSTFLVTHTSL